ncbi:GntR family transcriptional regulator [Quadrisphaera sp. DSM 44207]|uniref:GntR family transcriptional regulator n=1 Tax=Quadrisphaera sp. DSM 44207 TaxID=1881057 RepID=UPI0008910DE1|nr:GntR family transcriptional regulator [Quadrisphaera sp. DSM 44207]SDQ15424.1 transcriptional regulator, GntR family [Quadrisphaera sp. DSM 44207]
MLLDGPVPKHQQLRDILTEAARTTLGPDAPIPSERELTARYGVSRATVREAIGQLVGDGVLYRIHGKGTFVARPRVQTHLHLASFTQDMRRRGHEPSTRVRSVRREEPPRVAAHALRLPPGAPAWRLERLRLADGEPMALERGWYPAQRLPDLDGQDLTGSLYELLATRYGAAVDSGEQVVWSEVADPATARALAGPSGLPVLVFRRTSAAGGAPVEHVTSWYRGDRYQVQMSLGRTPAP